MTLFTKHQSRIDLAIDRVHNELESDNDPSSVKRKAAVDELLKLEEVKVMQAKTHISKDTLLTVGCYAGLTLLIVGVEIFGHSITSKAMAVLAFRPKI
jgi:hypothetical protein